MADMLLVGTFLLVLAGIGWNLGPKMWAAVRPPKTITKWPRNPN